MCMGPHADVHATGGPRFAPADASNLSAEIHIHRLTACPFLTSMDMQMGLGSSVLAARRLDSEPVPFEDEYDEVRAHSASL